MAICSGKSNSVGGQANATDEIEALDLLHFTTAAVQERFHKGVFLIRLGFAAHAVVEETVKSAPQRIGVLVKDERLFEQL